MEVIYSH